MINVLLVDDDEVFRYATAARLTAAGMQVISARDHRDALKILQSDAALNVLVTDLVMPSGINGFALGRMALMRRPALKVVYMTGFHELPVSEAQGPVLFKPFTEEALMAAVQGQVHA